jgi:hypothetical protein
MNNTDGNLSALRTHEDKIALSDAREEAIEDEAVEVYDKIVSGGIVNAGGDSYSIDDFTADFDIDAQYFCLFVTGNDESMKQHAIEQLQKFCNEIATLIIDGWE